MSAPEQYVLHDACLWNRHDYGLMTAAQQKELQAEALDWLRAWQKAGLILATPAALSAAPEVQALVEAAVKRALEAAAASIRAEEKSSVYYQGRVQTFCYGMRDGFESSAQVAEEIAANPAEVRRIAEGRDE